MKTRNSICNFCRKLRRRMNDGKFSKLTLEEELEYPLIDAMIRDSLEVVLQSIGGCKECQTKAMQLSGS